MKFANNSSVGGSRKRAVPSSVARLVLPVKTPPGSVETPDRDFLQETGKGFEQLGRGALALKRRGLLLIAKAQRLVQ